MEAEVNLPKQLAAIQEVVGKWWKEWIKIAFPLLTPRRKWQQQFRNVREGDIVATCFERPVLKAFFQQGGRELL